MKTIKQLRHELGMNKKEFAKWLGVSSQTVTRWDLSKNSAPEYLPELIQFRIDNQELWGRGSVFSVSDFAELRKKTGLTLNDFASYLDIPRNVLESWEYKTYKPKQYVYKLVKFKIWLDYVYKK